MAGRYDEMLNPAEFVEALHAWPFADRLCKVLQRLLNCRVSVRQGTLSVRHPLPLRMQKLLRR